MNAPRNARTGADISIYLLEFLSSANGWKPLSISEAQIQNIGKTHKKKHK